MNQKTVLITGSTRGIGLAFVELYKTNGWNVIATARNLETASKLKALAPHKIVQLDTSDEDSILKAAQELQGEPLDLLINNAGIGWLSTIESATKDSLMNQFEVNAVGPFLVTRAFLPNLRAAVTKNGSAVVGQLSTNFASIGDNTSGDHYGYRASKAALNMINASLAANLKQDKIIAVVLHPGFVATDMNSYAGPVSPADSVAGMSKVLAGLTIADTGKFLSYDGESLAW